MNYVFKFRKERFNMKFNQIITALGIKNYPDLAKTIFEEDGFDYKNTEFISTDFFIIVTGLLLKLSGKVRISPSAEGSLSFTE